jgi:CheY-like chemotaxis protein
MFRFLLVDDNPAEAELLKNLLKTLGRPHQVYFVRNGIDALDFLHRRGAYFDAPRPDLILLDINMPKMNGFDVLVAIKNHPELRMTPVIMLSTSRSASDIRLAYQNHANSYVQKPANLEGAEKIIKAIQGFWLDVAVLPSWEEKMWAGPKSASK